MNPTTKYLLAALILLASCSDDQAAPADMSTDIADDMFDAAPDTPPQVDMRSDMTVVDYYGDPSFLSGFKDKCHALRDVEQEITERPEPVPVNEVSIYNADDYILFANTCRISGSGVELTNEGLDSLVYGKISGYEGERLLAFAKNTDSYEIGQITTHYIVVDPHNKQSQECVQFAADSMPYQLVSIPKLYNKELFYSLENKTTPRQIGWASTGWDKINHFNHQNALLEYVFDPNRIVGGVMNMLTPKGQLLAQYGQNMLSFDGETGELNWFVHKNETGLRQVFLDENNSFITFDESTQRETVHIRASRINGGDSTLSIDSCGSFSVTDGFDWSADCAEDICVRGEKFSYDYRTIKIEDRANQREDYIICQDLLRLNESTLSCINHDRSKTKVKIIDLKTMETKNEIIINQSPNNKEYSSALKTSSGVFIIRETIFATIGIVERFNFISFEGDVLRQLDIPINEADSRYRRDHTPIIMGTDGTIFFIVGRNIYHIKTNLKPDDHAYHARTYGYNARNTAQRAY